MQIITATFRGQKYQLINDCEPDWMDNEGALGECDMPDEKTPQIRVVQSSDIAKLKDTWLHEMLHASYPDLKEEAIDEVATDITKAFAAIDKAGWLKPAKGKLGFPTAEDIK